MTKISNEEDKGKLMEPAMRGAHGNVDQMMLFGYYKQAENLDLTVLGAIEKRKNKSDGRYTSPSKSGKDPPF